MTKRGEGNRISGPGEVSTDARRSHASHHPRNGYRLATAVVVRQTEAEGPGLRTAVWVSGCSLRCPGCCNPEMFSTGTNFSTVDTLVRQVLESETEGISLLGGEPMEQASALADLATKLQDAGRSVMIFTGYTLEELRARRDPATDAVLAHCDLLIDGRFERDKPDKKRRWVGSTNQRVHHLSDRYRDHPGFGMPRTVEFRLVDGVLTVVGWPGGARL